MAFLFTSGGIDAIPIPYEGFDYTYSVAAGASNQKRKGDVIGLTWFYK